MTAALKFAIWPDRARRSLKKTQPSIHSWCCRRPCASWREIRKPRHTSSLFAHYDRHELNTFIELRDTTFNAVQGFGALSGCCLRAAWQAFHADPPPRNLARVYARSAFVAAPDLKAPAYGRVSMARSQLLQQFTRRSSR